MTVCLRCNKCCYYLHNGKKKKCKHSIVLISGRSLCRIFNKRLNTLLAINDDDTEIRCILRKNDNFDYPNCPFNTDKQIRDIWRNE